MRAVLARLPVSFAIASNRDSDIDLAIDLTAPVLAVMVCAESSAGGPVRLVKADFSSDRLNLPSPSLSMLARIPDSRSSEDVAGDAASDPVVLVFPAVTKASNSDCALAPRPSGGGGGRAAIGRVMGV